MVNLRTHVAELSSLLCQKTRTRRTRARQTAPGESQLPLFVMIFTSWMLFMLFGNIVMLNCAPCSLFTVFSLRSAWAPVTLVSTQTSDTFQFSLRSAWAPVTQHNHLTLAVMAVLISIVTS